MLKGGIQGLHNIHGSFNVPNMPGTLGSRNASINSVASSGVQQTASNLSGGRLHQITFLLLSQVFCLFLFGGVLVGLVSISG